MKILLVNNFYYNRGGDCTYLFSLKNLLERKGHKVIVFSMHHPQNFDSEYSEYFVSYINYADMAKSKSLSSGLKVLFRSIYSLEAKRKMEALIEKERPDIAHLNNIRQHVTTSILPVLKKNRIPIVWTLHDYQLICPNISFLSGGKICERCKKRKYFWPMLVRCKKGSFLASIMAAVEHSVQMFSGVYNIVDFFITPSEFLRSKLVEYGVKADKIICLNNFIDSGQCNENVTEGAYCLYVGRLDREKGVRTLIDAAMQLKTVSLKIVGDGSLGEELESYVDSENRNGKIEFLGHRSHEDVMALIRNCMFLVLPSEWYENFPYAILEAFACGKPVIGSRTGGIPELVRDNETGLTFEMGNSDDLSSKMKYLMNNQSAALKMGRNARTYMEQELGPEKHYKKLMGIYKKTVSPTFL
jgi:glycosyltransferase involved in cell wall biosynthesis